MGKKVKFLRNGSPNWIGIKFPNRKGAVWIAQSDFDNLVDTILNGLVAPTHNKATNEERKK